MIQSVTALIVLLQATIASLIIALSPETTYEMRQKAILDAQKTVEEITLAAKALIPSPSPTPTSEPKPAPVLSDWDVQLIRLNPKLSCNDIASSQHDRKIAEQCKLYREQHGLKDPSPRPKPTPSPTPPAGMIFVEYVIQNGDTIQGIAERYNVDPKIITEAVGSEIKAGKIIRFLAPTPEELKRQEERKAEALRQMQLMQAKESCLAQNRNFSGWQYRWTGESCEQEIAPGYYLCNGIPIPAKVKCFGGWGA